MASKRLTRLDFRGELRARMLRILSKFRLVPPEVVVVVLDWLIRALGE